MKEPQEFSAWLFRLLLVCSALLLVAGCATNAGSGIQSSFAAKVVYLKGGARYKVGNNDWQTLRAGDVVKSGTLIQTTGQS